MRPTRLARTLPAFTLAFITGAATAAPIFDETDANVTSDVIFGSGNTNGGFTVSRSSGVEIGLRGKLRFDENNQPQNTFNSNGDGSYTFQAGNPPTGFGFDPNNPTTPVWNFEWSINTDFDGSTGKNLSDFYYVLTLDVDPGPGVTIPGSGYIDPINGHNPATNGVQWDHAIGDNSTSNGGGTSISNNVSDAVGYGNLINNNNVAQNSWSYEFFNTGAGDPTFGFNPSVAGSYSIGLTAIDKDDETTTSTSIEIKVASVPEPGTLALFGLGLAGIGLSRRRKFK